MRPQTQWKIVWKKKGDRGEMWCVVCSKTDADRYEAHFRKNKDYEYVRVENPDDTAFKQFPKKT